MMLTIMLITDGSVRIMSYGSELTRGTSVYDFTVMGNDQIVEKYLSNEQIRPYVSNLNRMEIGNIKSTASDGISLLLIGRNLGNKSCSIYLKM